MSVLSVNQLSNFNVNDIKALEKAEKKLAKEQKKIAKAQEKITKEQEKAGKDGTITVKEEKKIAKAQEKAEKKIAKAQEKGLYLNQGTDTVSISKEGMALSRSETRGNNINKIDKLRLKQQRHEGKVRGKMKRKRGKEDIFTSLKKPVEQNNKGKEVSASSLERPVEKKNQSENVSNSTNNLNKGLFNLESSSKNPYKNFLGFLNANGENGLFQQGAKSINIFA